MSWLIIVPWLIAVLAIIGLWLNCKQDRRCFVIWSITNAAWSIINFQAKQYAQSFLFFVYFILAVYGFNKWSVLYAKKTN